jgi:hypothetical protein
VWRPSRLMCAANGQGGRGVDTYSLQLQAICSVHMHADMDLSGGLAEKPHSGCSTISTGPLHAWSAEGVENGM